MHGARPIQDAVSELHFGNDGIGGRGQDYRLFHPHGVGSERRPVFGFVGAVSVDGVFLCGAGAGHGGYGRKKYDVFHAAKLIPRQTLTPGKRRGRIFNGEKISFFMVIIIADCEKSFTFAELNKTYRIIFNPKLFIMAYVITDKCVACGSCLPVCPVEAISEGDIYHIDPDTCIECGSCAEVCPSEAILPPA